MPHRPTVPRYGPYNMVPIKARDGSMVTIEMIKSTPAMDRPNHYDYPSPSSSVDSDASEVPTRYEFMSNSGNKLEPGARWMRKGKLYGWNPSYDDTQTELHIRKRFKVCMEQLLPESSAECGVLVPVNIEKQVERRKAKKRKLEEEQEWILPHLASPSPPLSTAKLAPLLAIPQTYTEIMLSASMRHSLGDDTVETGLQRTAAELLESEKPLMQALGRLREVLRVRERDMLDEEADAKANGASKSEAAEPIPTQPSSSDTEEIDPLPHISDTDNLWRVTQELLQPQPPPTITFTVTPAGTGAANTDQPEPTPVQRLFTCKTGITVNAIPAPNAQPLEAGAAPLKPTRYNLDMNHQCRAVDDALERIAELLADCNEYKERLEEARNRVADVARARKKVWSIIKQRALTELDREGK